MNSEQRSIWCPGPKRLSAEENSFKDVLDQLALERARNVRIAHNGQVDKGTPFASQIARIAQAAQSTHLESQNAQTAQERRERLDRSSFYLWKKVPTEAQRKVLDEQYPEGWYLNKLEKVCSLGEREKDGKLDREKIAYLWECFPTGWYLGDQNGIHVCPGGVAGRTFITAQQVSTVLDSGEFSKELQKLQLDVATTQRHTVRKKRLHTALTEISQLLKEQKYPLGKGDIQSLRLCVQKVLSNFPVNFIPHNHKVPIQISHYVELYISLKRMKIILEKKASQQF